MRKMLFAAALPLFISGCWGYSQQDNQMTGQVKKIHHNTPIICPDYYSVDVSLGIMNNGVGSMSHQDITLTVWNPDDITVLEAAAKKASIVEIKYNTWRFALCREDDVIQYTKVIK